MRYRVYALDLFGYGDSGKNPRKYTLQHQVDMLEEFMDQLAIPKAAFIGHGLGAMILAEFGFKHQQERIPRMMLISPPLYDIGGLPNRTPIRISTADGDNETMLPPSMEATIPSAGMMRQALLERAAVRNKSRGVAGNESSAQANGPSSTNPLAESIANTNLTALLDRCFKRTDIEYEKLQADIPNTDERVLIKSIAEYDAPKMLDTVNQLQMPTMFIHGEADPLIPVPSDDVWNYVTDNNEQKVALTVNGARHFPMLENDRFGRFVLDFLEAQDITKLEGIKGSWQRRSR